MSPVEFLFHDLFHSKIMAGKDDKTCDSSTNGWSIPKRVECFEKLDKVSRRFWRQHDVEKNELAYSVVFERVHEKGESLNASEMNLTSAYELAKAGMVVKKPVSDGCMFEGVGNSKSRTAVAKLDARTRADFVIDCASRFAEPDSER